jgi:hypothetical protein
MGLLLDVEVQVLFLAMKLRLRDLGDEALLQGFGDPRS